MSLFDPAQLLDDIKNAAMPVVTKARSDADAALSTAADEAKTAAHTALTKLRSDVGAAAEVARGAFVEAVKNAEPGVQTAVNNVLNNEFESLLKTLSSAVL